MILLNDKTYALEKNENKHENEKLFYNSFQKKMHKKSFSDHELNQ